MTIGHRRIPTHVHYRMLLAPSGNLVVFPVLQVVPVLQFAGNAIAPPSRILLHKFLELRVRHQVFVHIKAADTDLVFGLFVIK